jgi:hypothetical protein
VAAFVTPADRLEPVFATRMRRIRKYGYRVMEHGLDSRDRYAVFLALLSVALIPIKAGNSRIHQQSPIWYV